MRYWDRVAFWPLWQQQLLLLLMMLISYSAADYFIKAPQREVLVQYKLESTLQTDELTQRRAYLASRPSHAALSAQLSTIRLIRQQREEVHYASFEHLTRAILQSGLNLDSIELIEDLAPLTWRFELQGHYRDFMHLVESIDPYRWQLLSCSLNKQTTHLTIHLQVSEVYHYALDVSH